MFTLILPNRDTAKLILYYARIGAESKTDSLVEAPLIRNITMELLETLIVKEQKEQIGK